MTLLTVNSNRLFFTGGVEIAVDAPLEIKSGLTALTGPNGSGKTVFARILESGRNFLTNHISAVNSSKPIIRYLEFNNVHSWIGNSVEYYQQRYESTMNDDVPTVAQVMGRNVDSPEFLAYTHMLNLGDVRDRKINYLSSGELRKLLIINALLESPHLLILDNPYIGLDADSKIALNSALLLLRDKRQSVMLVLSDDKDVPATVDHRLYASHLTVSEMPFPTETIPSYRPFGFSASAETTGDSGEILDLNGATIKYGARVIVDSVDWHIGAGERWSLSGPNGSGKSTLLSLVCADNPKSYSLDVSLFGRRRGSGESIWDVKRHIGYVSPEMQLHFHGSGTVEQIVANGLNDTVGLYVKPVGAQLEKARRLLEHFNIGHLAARNFMSLSSGERQLALVARALIKEPKLLILDEPMHALDARACFTVESTIGEFLAARPDAAFVMVTHNPDELPPSITHHLKLKVHDSGETHGQQL